MPRGLKLLVFVPLVLATLFLAFSPKTRPLLRLGLTAMEVNQFGKRFKGLRLRKECPGLALHRSVACFREKLNTEKPLASRSPEARVLYLGTVMKIFDEADHRALSEAERLAARLDHVEYLQDEAGEVIRRSGGTFSFKEIQRIPASSSSIQKFNTMAKEYDSQLFAILKGSWHLIDTTLPAQLDPESQQRLTRIRGELEAIQASVPKWNELPIAEIRSGS